MSEAAISRFLPPAFKADRPLVVIAGRGQYPFATVAAARRAGVPTRLIAFDGETSESLWEDFSDNERARIKVGQVGHMLKALQQMGAASAIMAGQITPRRLFKGLHPDLKAVKLLATLKVRNAETIFGALAEEINAVGVQLLDARAFLDSELADADWMVKGRYLPDAETLAHGRQIVREMARLDVGQGVVVARGTVLAVEAFEGTDPMLQRAGSFGANDPLFVKGSKPQQDTRFDVPVFGRRTLEVMASAGIAAAALEAGKTLMLEKDKVLAEAARLKLTLLGYT